MSKTDKISEKINSPKQNGGKRPGAGRPKGALNVKTKEVIEHVEATGETPLQYMLRVMRTAEDEKRRDQMAISAAPYVHARLTATTLEDKRDITKWSKEQVIAAIRAIDAAAAAVSTAVDAEFRVVGDHPANGSGNAGQEA